MSMVTGIVCSTGAGGDRCGQEGVIGQLCGLVPAVGTAEVVC